MGGASVKRRGMFIMSNLIYMEINDVLELHQKGASVRTIASMTGISKSTVSRILRGERKWDNIINAPSILDDTPTLLNDG